MTVLSRGDGTGGFVAEIRVANGTKERDQSMPKKGQSVSQKCEVGCTHLL